MTARRLTHHAPQPRLTKGDDLPQPACDYSLIGAIMECRPNSGAYSDAVEELRELCAECPLVQECHRDNANEAWLQAIRGNSPIDRMRDARLSAREARSAERAERLYILVDQRADLSAILADLNVSRTGFQQWCRKNGHVQVWHGLLAREKAAA